jgi:hypothetical protein
MDFIERIFGISPDGGSGSLEFLLLTLPIIVVAYGIVRRQRRRRWSTRDV